MAYVSHSPIRDLSIAAISPHLLIRSVAVAAAAAIAVLALSEANVGASSAQAPTTAFAKSDRLAAPIAVPVTDAGYSVDAASGVTTVERGAATPFSADSPFVAAAK